MANGGAVTVGGNQEEGGVRGGREREQKPQQGFRYNIFATAEPRYYNRNAYRFLRRMRASLVNGVHPAYGGNSRGGITRGGRRIGSWPKEKGGGGRNLGAIADISLVREPDVKWGIIPGVEERKGRGLHNRANEETCEDSSDPNRTVFFPRKERGNGLV